MWSECWALYNLFFELLPKRSFKYKGKFILMTGLAYNHHGIAIALRLESTLLTLVYKSCMVWSLLTFQPHFLPRLLSSLCPSHTAFSSQMLELLQLFPNQQPCPLILPLNSAILLLPSLCPLCLPKFTSIACVTIKTSSLVFHLHSIHPLCYFHTEIPLWDLIASRKINH